MIQIDPLSSCFEPIRTLTTMEVFPMTRVLTTIDEHPRLISGVLLGVVLFFLAACLLNDVIPICHWLFGCDHRFHVDLP